MKKKFWLKRIQLHKSPGFEAGTFPPVDDLGEHLNVIWGPNAVGKSTLTRAMRSLIWGGRSNSEVEVTGLLKADESPWNLTLSNGRLHQKRLSDDQELLLPGRNDELSESYWFTLHELLQEDAPHASTFLREVQTRMQGGVDLERASAHAGGITSFSTGAIRQATGARQASEHYRQVLRSQDEHRDIQDRIAILEQEVAQNKELSLQKVLLQDAMFLLETSTSIEEKEQALCLYHPSIDRIDKSSPQRLQDLLLAQTKAGEEVRSAIQTANRLGREFSACAIAEDELKDLDRPDRIANQYEAYKEACVLLEGCEHEFALARQALLEWEEEHSWLVGEPPQDQTLQAYIGTLKTLSQECEPLRCAVDANKRLLDELGLPETIPHPLSSLTELTLRLSDWMGAFWSLKGTPRSSSARPMSKLLLLVLVLAMAGVSSALGLGLHPLFFMLGFALVIGSVALFVPSPKEGKEYRQAQALLEQAQGRAEQLLTRLGKEGPERWDAEPCQRLQIATLSEIATVQRLEQLNAQRQRAQEQLDASVAKLKGWATDWQEAAKALGLKDDESQLQGKQFFYFAERLNSWSSLRLALVKAGQALASAQEQERQALSRLQAELGTAEDEIGALKARSSGMIGRIAQAKALQVAIAENERALAHAQEELEKVQEKIQVFWQHVGLEFGDERALSDLVSDLEAYQGLKLSLQYTHTLFDEKCLDAPEAYAMMRTHTLEDLSALLEKVIKDQGALEHKWEELGKLRSIFEALKRGSDLSRALQEKELALDELELYRQQQVASRLIASLASELKEESKSLYQPQVLKHASSWLGSITDSRYTLSAGDGGFFATDTIMARNYSLDELSSGTRIHLLFSIRMAFITMQEETSGVALPIFMDELLANSDDRRAFAIVKAIGVIAAERQVFYVTAQRDEVEKLMTIGSSSVKVIALEDLSREFRLSKTPLKPYIYAREGLADPVGDYHEYGTLLRVAGPSLWQNIASLHSWHLCLDSAELYGYLKKGLRRVGQLAQALGPDHALSFRMKMLASAQSLAQEGRCRILDASALEEAPPTLNRGNNYWTQMLERVQEAPLTGNELLTLIADKRIKNFTGSKLEIFTTWLMEQGYATERSPKGVQEILDTLFVLYDKLETDTNDEKVIHRWLDSVVG
ncbi:MAG: hypothetical protein RBR15_14440 [Sphaerochaeta sp.]|nr:hypothetical protein [Sphaerochaeta sp.]